MYPGYNTTNKPCKRRSDFHDIHNNSNINDLDSYNVTRKGVLERALRLIDVSSTHDC